MKNPLAFGIAFLLGTLVTLKPVSLAQNIPDDFAIRAGRTEAVVPFEYPQHEIVIAVIVNGRGPFHFLFDTGGDLAISSQVAKTLGLSVKEGEVRGQGVGEAPVVAGSTQLSSLQLGAVTLKKLQWQS